MDSATRHRRIAQRFLVSIAQQYGSEAPVILRQWADELEHRKLLMMTAEPLRVGPMGKPLLFAQI